MVPEAIDPGGKVDELARTYGGAKLTSFASFYFDLDVAHVPPLKLSLANPARYNLLDLPHILASGITGGDLSSDTPAFQHDS